MIELSCLPEKLVLKSTSLTSPNSDFNNAEGALLPEFDVGDVKVRVVRPATPGRPLKVGFDDADVLEVDAPEIAAKDELTDADFSFLCDKFYQTGPPGGS